MSATHEPSPADHQTDLLIVGGGMVGLTLANAVAAAGLTVTVVDRQAPDAALDVAFDGRVSAIAAGSVRLLRALGVWQGIEPDAQPILDIRVSDGDAPWFLHYDHGAVGDEPFGYIVENRVLRRALHARAATHDGIEHRAPASLDQITRSAAGVSATLNDGTGVTARLVAAADGRRSSVRDDAGIRVIRRPYRQIAIVCTIAHEKPHDGVAQERFLTAGPFAILPMTGHRSSLVWTERADLAPAMLALDDAAFLDEVRWRFTDFLGELSLDGPRWSYPLELSWATRIVDRRLALIGDAAHAIHPIAGQGLNLGLRDVAALAEVLVDAHRLGLDIGTATVLARYQRWRRFDVASMSVITDALNYLFANDIVPIKLARGLGLSTINRLPSLKRIFMRHAMGLVGDLPRLVRGELL
jgi:2-octaprenyl-6-methoxyphenol hydroxylase